MARTLTALVLGLLLGVGGTWLLRSPSFAEVGDLGDLGTLPPAAPASEAAEAVVSAAAREGGRDFYQQLADASAAELAGMIRQAASEPRSTDRELALSVLLKRYSELDATGAVRLAREAGVTGTGLTAVYGAWARQSPAQALAALGTVDSPDAAADVALALIAALGNGAAAVERVAAVLSARGEDAPISPGVAPVPIALGTGRSALVLTAERWAAIDGRHALAVAEDIGDERVQGVIKAAAMRALARTSPDEAFGYLSSLGNDPQQLAPWGNTLAELARADPERVLAAASNFPTDVRRMAESMALQLLAERDPMAALRYVERLPVGMERMNFTQIVARSYGRKDATAAMAWARSLPDAQNVLPAVLGGIAEGDPNRAIDLALELRSPMERQRALQFVAMSGMRQEESFETVANRLLALDDPQLQNSLAFNVVGMWASRSPDRAMNWLLANGRDAPANVFMQIGQQIAMRDPRNAASYTAQVPEGAREPWMQGVAQGYAQADPQGAVGWLEQFRGEPWYDRAAATVAMSVAQRDGAAAARLAADLDTERLGPQAQQLASMIASNWANNDPAAAAAWASERPSEQERAMAVRSVAGIWANNDPDAARQWAVQLPQTLRDGALAPVLTSTAHRSPSGLDTRVLSAFTSDAARQQAVLQVVQTLAYADAAKARAIADTHLSDAGLRSQAEQVLEAARTGGGRGMNFGINSQGIAVPALRVR